MYHDKVGVKIQAYANKNNSDVLLVFLYDLYNLFKQHCTFDQ
jgi:hypothetical protein